MTILRIQGDLVPVKNITRVERFNDNVVTCTSGPSFSIAINIMSAPQIVLEYGTREEREDTLSIIEAQMTNVLGRIIGI